MKLFFFFWFSIKCIELSHDHCIQFALICHSACSDFFFFFCCVVCFGFSCRRKVYFLFLFFPLIDRRTRVLHFFFFLSWCEIRNCISIFLTLEIGGWKIHNRVGLFVCLLACLLLFFHSHGRQVCWWCFDFEMQSWTKQVRKTLLMLAHKFQTRILIDPSYRKRTIDTAHQNVLLK